MTRDELVELLADQLAQVDGFEVETDDHVIDLTTARNRFAYATYKQITIRFVEFR